MNVTVGKGVKSVPETAVPEYVNGAVVTETFVSPSRVMVIDAKSFEKALYIVAAPALATN